MWQPIETAPRDGTPVILYLAKPMDRRWVTEGRAPNVTIGFLGSGNPDYSPHDRWVSVEVEDNGSMGGEMTGWMDDWCCIDVKPSHWMPIPEAPKS